MKITWDQWELIKSSGILKGYGISSDEIDNIVLKELALYQLDSSNEYQFKQYQNVSELTEADLQTFSDNNIHIAFNYSNVYISKFFIKNNIDKLLLIKDLNIGDTNNFDNIINDYKQKEDVNFEVLAAPRPEQLSLFRDIDELYKENGFISLIIKAAPGVGKSFMSLKIASNYKKRTLIILPNDVLEKQWKETIIDFSNKGYEDIGIIQGSDLDKLQNEIQKDIIVCKVQSLMSQIRKYSIDDLKEYYSNIDMVVYDEAHTSASATSFAHTAFIFKTPNIIELTATPFNKGTHDFLMKNNVNDYMWESDHQNLIPSINIHNPVIPFTDQQKSELDYFRGLEYTMFLAKYNSMLYDSELYMQYLAQWVAYRSSQGHKVAVLFSTNKMIQKMYRILLDKYHLDFGVIIGKTDKEKKLIPPVINEEELEQLLKMYKKVYPNRKKEPSWKIGSKFNKVIQELIIKHSELFPEDEQFIMRESTFPKTEMEIAKEKQGVISNYQSMQAGYDDSKLSCILFGSLVIGKNVVIQTLGRIARVNANKVQDIQAHFFFTSYYTTCYPNMKHVLMNNIKVQYPTSKFTLEGFSK